MSQNNTKLHDLNLRPQVPVLQKPNSKACAETGEFYDNPQKPVKNEKDQYFKSFGAGGGYFKNLNFESTKY